MAIYSISSVQNLIIGGSGSGKTYTLHTLYAKDLSEPKYEVLINRRENAGTKHLNDSKAFIECSNPIDDV